MWVLCAFLGFAALGTRAQNAAGYRWGSVAIGGGGFVSAIIPSKTEQGLVYARTDVGGAYRWDAVNSAWVPLQDWTSQADAGYLGVEALALDPQAPNKLYMLVGTSYWSGGRTAILRSDDYGATFTTTNVTSQFRAHGNGMGRQTGEKLVVDPRNGNVLYCGTRWNGLFRSTDAGATWARLPGLPVTTTPNENGISFVVPDPASHANGQTQTMYVGVSSPGANLYRSTDGGQTFAAIPGGPTTLLPQRAVLASDGHLYVTYANGAGPHGHWNSALNEPMDKGQVWKYNTQTGAWTNITPAGTGLNRPYAGISVDPTNPQRVIVSTINTWLLQADNAYGDRIFSSTNGGTSWTDVFARGMRFDNNGISWITGQAIHWAGSLEFDPFDPQQVWVSSGNGIFRTANLDATPSVWKFEVRGLEETVPLDLVSIPNGPLVSVIGDYDGFRHTDPTQYGTIHTPRMGTTTGLAVASLDPNIMLRVGDKMYHSTNRGQTWTENPKNGNKGKVAVSANGATFLHSPEGSANTTTYRTTNRGTNWTAVTGLAVPEAFPVADPVNPAKFYVYNRSSGNVQVSTNGGVSFSAGGAAGPNGSKVIRAAPGREGDVWVPLAGNGLTRSTDSGQSFNKVAAVAQCDAVGFGKAAEGSTYPTIFIWGRLNNELGIHRSTDEGATWLRVNDDAHQFGGPGNGQFVVGDMNVFGRVYMSTVGRGLVYGELDTSLPTATAKDVALPFAYAPNPFTGSLSVTLPEPFTYSVYNLVGSLLQTGASAGTVGLGADLRPGVYLLTIKSRDRTKTVRIVKQ